MHQNLISVQRYQCSTLSVQYISGFPLLPMMVPAVSSTAAKLSEVRNRLRHLIFCGPEEQEHSGIGSSISISRNGVLYPA